MVFARAGILLGVALCWARILRDNGFVSAGIIGDYMEGVGFAV